MELISLLSRLDGHLRPSLVQPTVSQMVLKHWMLLFPENDVQPYGKTKENQPKYHTQTSLLNI